MSLLVIGGIKAGTALIGRRNQRKGAREQEALDAENRKLYNLEVGESIRRTEASQAQTEGLASTQAAGAGFGVGSSLDSYVETIQAQHAGDIDWMRTSGASQSDIMEREASARKRSSDRAGNVEFAKGIGSAFSSFAGGEDSGFKW